jgi:hypothetical protein
MSTAFTEKLIRYHKYHKIIASVARPEARRYNLASPAAPPAGTGDYEFS